MSNNLGYNAVLSNAAVIKRSDLGLVQVLGENRVGFLQTQTSNDFTLLNQKTALVTVLTTPLAKILHVFEVIEYDKSLFLLVADGQASKVSDYLADRIFFGDQVEIVDQSTNYVQWDLEGVASDKALQKIGVKAPPKMDQVLRQEIDTVPVCVIGVRGLNGIGYRLLHHKKHGKHFAGVIEQAQVSELSHESREVLRVEAGLPRFAHELCEDYNPLEVNLDWAVSIEKGCYTGQEVVARQINFDKVARRLCGIDLDRPIQTGQDVLQKGKRIGKVTTALESPSLGPIALAVIKRSYLNDKSQVEIKNRDQIVKGKVLGLPFDRG